MAWERAWGQPSAGNPRWNNAAPSEHLASLLARRILDEDELPLEDRRLEAELDRLMAQDAEQYDPYTAALDAAAEAGEDPFADVNRRRAGDDV